jgi:hypothetical protein
MPRGSWTSEAVELALVRAFAALVAAPVFSPRENVLLPLVYGRGAAPMELIGLTSTYLGRSSRQRLFLLTWARAQAGVGASASEACREQGWSRATFERDRRKAAETVAAGLNNDGVPVARTLALTTIKAGADR